jgi:lipopolysaccharide biosynthesis glycosyltransferase
MKKVFVIISDGNYLEHAKSLFFNAKNEGKWQGDFCLIANNLENYDLSDFEKFGVKILYRNCDNKFRINLHVFDSYFKQWEYVVYIDCDFMIFKDLENMLSNYDLFFEGVLADKEPFRIHQYLCQNWDIGSKEKKLKPLRLKYNLEKFGFNAGFFGFNTKIINNNTLQELFDLENEIQEVNNHIIPSGSDQPIFNLYFKDVLYVENKDVCFCGVLDHNTTAAHFCGGDRPWTRNEFSNHFGKTYKEKYDENLKGFYECIN